MITTSDPRPAERGGRVGLRRQCSGRGRCRCSGALRRRASCLRARGRHVPDGVRAGPPGGGARRFGGGAGRDDAGGARRRRARRRTGPRCPHRDGAGGDRVAGRGAGPLRQPPDERSRRCRRAACSRRLRRTPHPGREQRSGGRGPPGRPGPGAPVRAGRSLPGDQRPGDQPGPGRSPRGGRGRRHGAFYRGRIAEAIVARVQEMGGYLTLEDLHAHRTVPITPLSTEFRDSTVWELPQPTQGPAVLTALDGIDDGPIDWAQVLEAIRAGLLSVGIDMDRQPAHGPRPPRPRTRPTSASSTARVGPRRSSRACSRTSARTSASTRSAVRSTTGPPRFSRWASRPGRASHRTRRSLPS